MRTVTIGITIALVCLGFVQNSQAQRCLYFDFDEDGVADYDVVTRLDLEPFEPAYLYVGVACTDVEYSGVIYRVIYTGLIVPSVVTYNPGNVWIVWDGNLFEGGWLQAESCRPAERSFIARMTVYGTGSAQYLDFAETTYPSTEPGRFALIRCPQVDWIRAGALNAAACDADPHPVSPELACECVEVSAGVTPWGQLKSLLR